MVFWIAAALASAPPPFRAPVISPGCQGELCHETGRWIARRDLPFFDHINGVHRAGIIPEGTAVAALESRVVTSRIGLGRMLRTGDFLHKYGAEGPPIRVRKGELVYLLHEEGEGLHAAMTRRRQRVSLNGFASKADPSDFRWLRKYVATNWVRVRLPDGRVGWTRPSEEFLCSTEIDAGDKACADK